MALNTNSFGQYANTAQPTQPATISDKEKQPTGTGFTNLSQILAANQGAGQGLQNAVAGTINNAGNQAQQGLQTAQQQFGSGLSQAEQSQNAYNNLVQNTQSQISDPNWNGNLAPGAAQGYQNLANATYTGPTGLQNTGQLQAQAAQAAQYGQLANSQAGQRQLLAQTIGNPNYTQGEQSLDQLILGQAGPGLTQAAQNAQQQASGVNRAIAAAQGQGSAQAAALQNLQQQASQGVQSAASGVNSQISQEQEQEQANATQQANQLSALQQALVTGGTIDPTQYTNTGLTSQQIANIQALTNPFTTGQGASLGSQYATDIGGQLAAGITAGVNPTDAGDAATAQQRAQANALASLAGQTGPFTNFTPTAATAAAFNPNSNFSTDYVNQLQTQLGLAPSQQTNEQYGQALQTAINNLAGSGNFGSAQQIQQAAINPNLTNPQTLQLIGALSDQLQDQGIQGLGAANPLVQQGYGQYQNYVANNPAYQQDLSGIQSILNGLTPVQNENS